MAPSPKNVLGTALETCCTSPMTGFYRTGKCETGRDDLGRHVVCARVTTEFLAYTRSVGNDLSTPRPGFPGLKEGDRWCLCVSRWRQSVEAGVPTPVVLAGTHESALEVVSMEELMRHAVEPVA